MKAPAKRSSQSPTYGVEVHALRIGDVAIITNPFELFLDFRVQMQRRSKALQTFVLQLTCGSGGYLPTERAVKGGSYSAVVRVSPHSPVNASQGARPSASRAENRG